MNTIGSLLKVKGNEVWSISPDATAYEAIQLLAEKNVGSLMVVDGDQVQGILSERDYVRKIDIKGRSGKETPVRDIMTKDVIHAELGTTIDECMALMTDKHIRHLPIYADGKLAGVISIGDLVKAIINEQQRTIEQLGQYISG